MTDDIYNNQEFEDLEDIEDDEEDKQKNFFNNESLLFQTSKNDFNFKKIVEKKKMNKSKEIIDGKEKSYVNSYNTEKNIAKKSSSKDKFNYKIGVDLRFLKVNLANKKNLINIILNKRPRKNLN